MPFEQSKISKEFEHRLSAFMDAHIYPVEAEVNTYNNKPENAWKPWPGIEDLKDKARDAGLWNLFLPKEYKQHSPGLSNLDYAPLAEIMGRARFASEVFNCSPPDTGNMEVLARYGSTTQQERWLQPLLAGSIRSCFLMTEPDVASSDATNIRTSIVKEGIHFRLNGRKWWSSGAMHPNAEIAIVMGKTDPSAERHKQQSMILVPLDSPGLEIMRPLSVFGYYDSPEGHAEVSMEDVVVPAENLILGEGRGFEIAQGRLGPGRIHHSMRLIGMAQRALELMCQRSTQRSTFGRKLMDRTSIRQVIARARCDIEQARLLTLSTADQMDKMGNKGAKDLIAMIKIVAPSMACSVIDKAIQLHGGLGLCEDTPLAGFYAAARALRLADGPDEVHMYQLGKNTIRKYAEGQ